MPQKRRVTDEMGDKSGNFNQCPLWGSHTTIVELEDLVNKLSTQMALVVAQNAEQLEILGAWRDSKAVARATRLITRIALGIAAIGGAILAIYTMGVEFVKWWTRS